MSSVSFASRSATLLSKAPRALQFVLPVIVVLVIWQIAVTLRLVPPIALPAPAAIWDRTQLLLASGQLLTESAVTLSRIVIAFSIAAFLGVTVGLAVARIEIVQQALGPLLRVAFPIPKMALYPAFIILLGAGAMSAIALGVAEAVFPMLFGTVSAASQVNPKLLWSAEALGSSRARMLFRVVLPAALPGILSALRVGLIGAIVGVFIGEMIAGANGLGQLMVRGWTLLDSPQLYVALFAIAILGLCLDSILLLVRRQLLRWSDESSD
jgi:NitT/TauT family transport system permease protein